MSDKEFFDRALLLMTEIYANHYSKTGVNLTNNTPVDEAKKLMEERNKAQEELKLND